MIKDLYIVRAIVKTASQPHFHPYKIQQGVKPDKSLWRLYSGVFGLSSKHITQDIYWTLPWYFYGAFAYSLQLGSFNSKLIGTAWKTASTVFWCFSSCIFYFEIHHIRTKSYCEDCFMLTWTCCSKLSLSIWAKSFCL